MAISANLYYQLGSIYSMLIVMQDKDFISFVMFDIQEIMLLDQRNLFTVLKMFKVSTQYYVFLQQDPTRPRSLELYEST